ncbi:hypothetical protein CspeluHIS016_0107200 [Cutaneotrichosporon spelunceum]|uniref:Uncharacterized protein n=1 Tax=Cutaneotrichosporon spelunceum TaxID=1672016 RepID=A0AAD3TP80_9TREE|nr:hypothetical protein CspeluHIS016_0107200 [Cutaneotrichosporon spelunceum]
MADSLPPISLAIGGGTKVWDDRELVNAYDAALLEFHIHNPGPGSWLDKATAALAKGQPLPGAADFGTAWYSASKPGDKDEQDEEQERPKKKAKKAKQKNPYASTKSAADAGPASPTYQPVSPGGPGAGYDTVEWPPVEENEDEDEDEEEWQGRNGYGQADEAGHVFPAPAGQWPSGTAVGRDEAIGYALHAQYWAGFWMGIAAAGRSGDGETSENGDSSGRARGAAGPRGKGRASPNGLRR